ncbi:MAG: DUF2723 domain-containing protein [Bacteroidota bacterium]
MNNFTRINNIIGWIIFLFASFIYIFTSEPTASFWDCGEYIATAYKLQVGHPPGAPLFQILGRFFSLFAFGDTALVARMINTMSALSSSFTILFLYWSIVMLARRMFETAKELSRGQTFAIYGAGIIGALAYTFSDSFWFSAVEGEVYAMSSFFTAIVFWAILKWERIADQSHADRWLILIAYLMGLSIGVHLLNLLAIPAITLVYYYKRFKPTQKGAIIAFGVSIIILAAVMYGIIPEVVKLFATTELLFVNSLGLPFHTGTVFFALLIIGLLAAGIYYNRNKIRPALILVYALGGIMALLIMLGSTGAASFFMRLIVVAAVVALFYFTRSKGALQNTILLSILFILIGYSSFIMLVIRSNAATPINENSPKDAISLLSYLNREQYGDWPKFYGHYYNAEVIDRVDGNPVYHRDNNTGKYEIIDEKKGTIPVYNPDHMTIFPRMWNSQEQRYINDYKSWVGITNDPDSEQIPTFGQNLQYFFRYQIGHMYWRYFMWNFAGRQNDMQGGYGNLVHGNWISGINFIDEARLGPQTKLPDNFDNNARNKFYLLPFALGLLGVIFHFRRRSRDAWVVALLFLMTGLAITIYLNQHSPQPRERDYAYAASFYAFAIWIGLGVIALYEQLKKYVDVKAAAIGATAVSLIVPIIMGAQGWDDHDRSGRYATLEMAKNYLNSCAPNAVLFTNGDNDTFPLWYAQEVEGIRMDVRVCNLSLLNGDWYVDQMVRKAYDSEPMSISLSQDQYRQGTRDVIYLIENENITEPVDVKALFDIIQQDESRLRFTREGMTIDYFPTKDFMLNADSAKVVDNGTIPPELAGQITPPTWKINRYAIQRSKIIMLDFLSTNDWDRPVYFASTTGNDAYLGLSNYFQVEGMAYRLLPLKSGITGGQDLGRINTDILYDNLMNKFGSGMEDPDIYLNEDNLRSSMNIRNIFGRLAKELVKEGKNDSAILVCDRIMELIPPESIPYNYFVMGIADAYLGAGATDKGLVVLEGIFAVTSQNLEYFFRFQGDKALMVDDMRKHYLSLAHEIRETARRHDQTEMHAKADQMFNDYYDIYVRQMSM